MKRLAALALMLLVGSHLPAGAETLQELLARSKRMTDAARAKDGFPPASDHTGTILECDRRIKVAQNAFARCAGARAARLAVSSKEDASTVASAVVAGCPVEREALVRSAWPYCIPDRPGSEAATDQFVRSVERDMLALIVEARSQAESPAVRPRADGSSR